MDDVERVLDAADLTPVFWVESREVTPGGVIYWIEGQLGPVRNWTRPTTDPVEARDWLESLAEFHHGRILEKRP